MWMGSLTSHLCCGIPLLFEKLFRNVANVLFNNTLNTFITDIWRRTYDNEMGNPLSPLTHSTHFICGYIMASDIR